MAMGAATWTPGIWAIWWYSAMVMPRKSPDRKFGWTVPVCVSSPVLDPLDRTRMSQAGVKCAVTVPTRAQLARP